MSGRGFSRDNRQDRDGRGRGRGGRGNYHQENQSKEISKKENIKDIDDLLNILKKKMNKTILVM